MEGRGGEQRRVEELRGEEREERGVEERRGEERRGEGRKYPYLLPCPSSPLPFIRLLREGTLAYSQSL